jgi:hypothetical protein
MSTISKEDYLKLLEELDREDDMDTHPIPEDAWIPSEPPVKMKLSNSAIVIDILDYKKNKIKEALYKSTNLRIGKYLIKIHSYHGKPDKKGDGTGFTMDIEVWETSYTTPSGAPCKMDYNKNFHKDNRFAGKPWLSYFTIGGWACDIPADTVVDVIRWIQTIQKLSAFL